jgi:hypothetical protein
MKTTKIIISLSILIAVYSCKQAEAPAEEAPMSPLSTFDSPFPKNNKRLSNILGDLLILKTNDSDTLTLKIISTKKDNVIINTETGDTLFSGTICKFRNLYYFNQKINDTAYYISAIKIDGKLIYGLSNHYAQSYDVDDNIVKGNNKKLVKYINSDTTIIRLRPDKQELKKLFNLIISSVVPDTILNYNKSYFEVLERKESITDLEEEDNNNSLKVYPNPATDFFNIELKHNSKSSFQLSDLNGRTILQGQLNELTNRIDINNQQKGVYLLTVINSENKETVTKKIVIK